MKRVKSVAIVIVIGFCLVLLPKTSRAEQEVGIGGKLIGKVPFLIGSLDFDQFGIEAGGGIKSTSTSYGTYSSDLSLTYYLANGRYIFPLNNQLKPYVGGGIVGVNATVTATGGYTEATVSGSSNGYDIFGGVELPLESYGFPVTVFGGMNYLNFEDITFEYEGESFTYPMSVGGTNFHVGVKLEF